MTTTRRPLARQLAIAALLLGAGAIAFVLFTSARTSYTLHAQFENAGQLVKGGRVQVAGRKVGAISDIELTDNGQADVEITIRDDDYDPLHVGTRAAIRAVGQAGVANRFVDILPGSERNAELADGATLPTTQTDGIVDLDALFNALGPPTRADIRGLISNSSKIFAGSGARYFNGMLADLDPALRETARLTGELSADRAMLRRLIATAGQASAAVASRSTDLESAVGHTSRALGAIASEREALADVLARAPGVLTQGRGTLANVSTAVGALRPPLRDVPAAVSPLKEFLGRLDTTLRTADPVVTQLRGELGDLRRSLAGFVSLASPTVRALNATGVALRGTRPILRGLRIYGSDFVLGIFNGLAGVATGNYNGAGHYARLEFTQTLQTFVGGLGADIFKGITTLAPSIINVRTGLTARCPGGNTPPAPDGSNPWIPDTTLCKPEHDQPASLNQP